MPILRYFTTAGSALLVLLFVTNAYFDDGSNSRFDGSLYERAIYAPRLEEVASATELRFTRDATPADHVKEAFGQFVANQGRRGKR